MFSAKVVSVNGIDSNGCVVFQWSEPINYGSCYTTHSPSDLDISPETVTRFTELDNRMYELHTEIKREMRTLRRFQALDDVVVAPSAWIKQWSAKHGLSDPKPIEKDTMINNSRRRLETLEREYDQLYTESESIKHEFKTAIEQYGPSRRFTLVAFWELTNQETLDGPVCTNIESCKCVLCREKQKAHKSIGDEAAISEGFNPRIWKDVPVPCSCCGEFSDETHPATERCPECVADEYEDAESLHYDGHDEEMYQESLREYWASPSDDEPEEDN